ncbi:hypothetical protein BbiDN127_H0003 (plasmid) [Borreliella bissettiae DN127]|uniref:Uncharacterized protein n=1 Tax=Borrelia bissettiae (strain DSM 17990 / CIP 109136 / DN127) TaxID=521010 RepID=G0AP38_BORBD|nr:hypothetical protein BbiDN127_H0003 [Borreliella bissettiae DN127]
MLLHDVYRNSLPAEIRCLEDAIFRLLINLKANIMIKF